MEMFTLLLQQGPAETTNYFIAGYTIIFLVMGLYVASYFIRFRNLRQEIQLLEELHQEN
ncbi:MAG: hypothetical protein JW862_03050 [Anaerolineales bacterium]|nr:hypothetical protein [Anaerolineales bacterium]